MDMNSRKIRVAGISVVSNALLVASKLVIGVAMSSVSVISEAIHSGIDLLAALIAFFTVRESHKPADNRHSYGHGKLENLSGTIEAALIFIAAIWIIYEAVQKLLHPHPIKTVGIGVLVMLVSAVVNMVVSEILFKAGKDTDSLALQADAWHLRTDVYTSAGVMLGLIIIWAGRVLSPSLDLSWVDPVTAIIVALLIMKTAYALTIRSAGGLLDISLPEEEERAVKDILCSNRISGFHNFRSRKAGSTRFFEFHVVVDPLMTVHDSHELNDKIVTEIKAVFPDSKTMVHIEPCDNARCEPKCIENCLVTHT